MPIHQLIMKNEGKITPRRRENEDIDNFQLIEQ